MQSFVLRQAYFQVAKLHSLYGNRRKFDSSLLELISILCTSIECVIISIHFCHQEPHKLRKYTDITKNIQTVTKITNDILYMQLLYSIL